MQSSASINLGRRRVQFPNHIDEHLSWPAWMRSFPNFNKAMAAVKSQVPFHPLIGVEPNFTQPEPDGSLVCKVEQCSSTALSLCTRLYSYTIDQQMIWAFFEDRHPCWVAFNVQNPNLSFFNTRPVILCGWFWNRAEYSHIGRNVG